MVKLDAVVVLVVADILRSSARRGCAGIAVAGGEGAVPLSRRARNGNVPQAVGVGGGLAHAADLGR